MSDFHEHIFEELVQREVDIRLSGVRDIADVYGQVSVISDEQLVDLGVHGGDDDG